VCSSDLGVALVAQLPEGQTTSIETLRALAVSKPLDASAEAVRTYPELVRRLDDAGQEWAEDVRVFTIYRAK
jgi:hypothetical protein